MKKKKKKGEKIQKKKKKKGREWMQAKEKQEDRNGSMKWSNDKMIQ